MTIGLRLKSRLIYRNYLIVVITLWSSGVRTDPLKQQIYKWIHKNPANSHNPTVGNNGLDQTSTPDVVQRYSTILSIHLASVHYEYSNNDT